MLTKDNIQINFDDPNCFDDEFSYVRHHNFHIVRLFDDIKELIDKSESTGNSYLFTNAELIRKVVSVTCEINKVIMALRKRVCSIASPYVFLSVRYYESELLNLAIRIDYMCDEIEYDDCWFDEGVIVKQYEPLWTVYSEKFTDEDKVMMRLSDIKKCLDLREKQNRKLTNQLYETVRRVLHCQYILTIEFSSEMISSDSFKLIIKKSAKEYFRDNIEKEIRLLNEQAIRLKRSAELTQEHWLLMKETEEVAINLAINHKLSESKDDNLKGYDEDFRDKLEDNILMIGDMREYVYYNELFNFDKALDDDSDLLESITFKNLNLFYRLVLRCDIIRCNLCPNLQSTFDAWIEEDDVTGISKTEKKSHQNVCRLSDTDIITLEEVKEYLSKGEWIKPATAKIIKDWIETLFGKKFNQLDKEDRESSVGFREFFIIGKKGKYASRIKVSTANIIGYLLECGYLPNSPKQLSKMFFYEESNDNNINKGRDGNRSDTFEKLIPFMDKYRLRIIEKHG